MSNSGDANLKISQKAKLIPIENVASKLGIRRKYVEKCGEYKAKISLDILKKLKSRKSGKYILVSAITPTPYGEGKTVTTIGLSMALNRLNKKSACTIRQPSLGPIFGLKGGASGAGYSQVVPIEDVNLHLTGDAHAVAAANNLCAAYLDNSLFRGNRFDIDVNTISWKRVMDINDRFLRHINVGMGSKTDGIPRKTGFEITAASEVMAILSLCEDLGDLRNRLGSIIVAYDKKMKPIRANDIRVAGAMAVLLKDAIKPNLLQTLERTPCFVHTGPYGNIAHGSSSVIADKMALKLCDYVVTESGFGADLGAEKFFDIKCRSANLKPDLAVLVCTIRGLKMHSGDFEIKPGKPLDPYLSRENVSQVERGCSNLDKQIENIKYFGVPIVVCINRYSTDTDKEIEAVKRSAMSSGANAVAVSEVWAKGSEGGVELAKIVLEVIKNVKSHFRYLYPTDLQLKDKISRVAKTLYGAKEIAYTETVDKKIAMYRKLKLDKLPVCMAKTQSSLSHDPKKKGRPRGFKLPVNDVQLMGGAGFINVICGDIKTMPALPAMPVGSKIDIDKHGQITGLF